MIDETRYGKTKGKKKEREREGEREEAVGSFPQRSICCLPAC